MILKKTSISKHFRRFRGFALHCKSTELAERLEYFELLADKRLGSFSSELKLISNLQNVKIIWIRSVFYFKSNSKGNVIQKFIEIDRLILVILHLAFKTKDLTYLSRFRGFALHYESAESAENLQDFVLILGNGLDYLLSVLN